MAKVRQHTGLPTHGSDIQLYFLFALMERIILADIILSHNASSYYGGGWGLQAVLCGGCSDITVFAGAWPCFQCEFDLHVYKWCLKG